MKRNRFKVVKAGETRRGTSDRTGMEWIAQEVVLEEVNDDAQYPESFAASIQGNDAMPGLREGEYIECTPFIRAREYNERFYNEVRVKNVIHLPGGTGMAAAGL